MSVIAGDIKKERRLPAFFPRTEWLVLGVLAIFVVGLSFAPLVRLVLSAIAPDGVPDFARMAALLGKKQVVQATFNTLHVAVLSTILALAMGTMAALLVALTDMCGKAAWVFAFILPLMIPTQVTALAWVQAFSPSSPVLEFLGLSLPAGGRHPLYSSTGIIMLLGIYNAPLVFLSVRAALRRLPSDLVEAGRAAGASPFFLLRTIILPLARAGIFAGAALSFVSAIGNFGIQAMLGIPARFPTLITLIYQRLNTSGPSALSDMAVLALLLASITIAGLAASNWLGMRRDVRVDGAARPINMPLGRARPFVEAGAWFLMAATLALPLSALITTSLVTGFGQKLSMETITFVNYANALVNQAAIRNAFFTSLWITAIASVVIMVVSLFLAYFLTWRKTGFVRFLHISSELAYALPGIIIGIAAILFFLKPIPVINVSIYGTVWIILAAYLSNFLALCLRPTLGGFAQIERSLEEAAQVAGAGFLRRMWDIIAPLAAPATMAGAIIVFMSALNEIQVSILLVSSSARTIGPMIIFLEEGGSSTLAAAVGCLMVVVVLVLMLVASAFSKYLPRGVLPWQS